MKIWKRDDVLSFPMLQAHSRKTLDGNAKRGNPSGNISKQIDTYLRSGGNKKLSLGRLFASETHITQ
jgi:hypothetical protein